jgi:hypothetical protein
VAALTLPARFLFQQGMVEMPLLHEAYHTRMIAVTGNAVLIYQLLVEWV